VSFKGGTYTASRGAIIKPGLAARLPECINDIHKCTNLLSHTVAVLKEQRVLRVVKMFKPTEEAGEYYVM
jgi:hypothetical protein